MQLLQITIITCSFVAWVAGANRCLLQAVKHGGPHRSPTVASEASSDVINEEETDGDYLEVDIRRHHGQPKSFIDHRIRQGVLSGHRLLVPFDTKDTGHRQPVNNVNNVNNSAPEPSQTVTDDGYEEHADHIAHLASAQDDTSDHLDHLAPAQDETYNPRAQQLTQGRAADQMAPMAGHPYTHIPALTSAEQFAAAQQAAQQLMANTGLRDASGSPSYNVNGVNDHTAHPSARPSYASGVRGLELLIGIMLGVLLSLFALTALGYWSKKPVSSSLIPAQPPTTTTGLSGGRLELEKFLYHGAWFKQFSWSLDTGSGSSDSDPVTILSDTREVGRVLGRLMARPDGEMYLTSAGSTWALLKRPRPNRRPEQLWDFKVCRADGTPYAEVRQRSETKCHIHDAVTQRRIMTVIGNFTYQEFFSGERSIHVWVTQGSMKPSMCAQCEARPEIETEGLPPASQSWRFHVTSASNIDASLVLAILLGLQDVHGAAPRNKPPVTDQKTSSSDRSNQGADNFRVGDVAGSPSGGGTGGAASSSSGNNGGQGGGSAQGSGQGGGSAQGSEERAPEKQPPSVTEPATAA